MNLRDGPTYPRFPRALIHPLGPLFRYLPLSLRRHLLYLRTYGRWGNFARPRLMSEKMQWRVINDRRAILAFSQDKLAAKEYVRRALASAGLEDLVRIPATLWVGTDVRELQAIANRLPTGWVLKPNHSCGRFRVLDSDTERIDWEELIATGDRWLQRDEEEIVFGNWAYGQARHLLIAEERVGRSDRHPLALKVHTHSGVTAVYFWIDESQISRPYACFRADGTWFRWRSNTDPVNESLGNFLALDLDARKYLLDVSQVIGEPFDMMRVDFFWEQGTLWFNELTAYHSSGLFPISAANNIWQGEAWTLPDLSAPDPREAEWRALLQGTPKGTLQR
jgi:hypothetical protein